MDFIYCKYNHEQYLSLSYGSGIFAFPWDNVCSYLSNCKKISSFTFPISEKSISSIELPEIGTELNLKDCELSERKILIIKNFMISHSSYKELAELVSTSESTVKKEMTNIQKKLGVKNQVELSMLLSLYKVKF